MNNQSSDIKELPKDWKWVKLGEVCAIVYGKGLLTKNLTKDGFPVFGANGIIGFNDEYLFEDSRVLISCRGAYSGKINFSLPKSYITNNSLVLDVLNKTELDKSYLFYSLSAAKKTKLVTGTAQPQVTINNAAELDIPLPPKPIQQAIVSKIEELFSELDKGIEQLKTAQQQLKTYRQAVLSAGTSGMLTGTHKGYLNSITIGKPTKLNRNWKPVKLIDISKLESGHTPRKDTPAYWENGNVLWLSLQDIRALDGKIAIDTKYKTNELGIKNSSARLLPEGTVCFCRDISVGFVAIMGKVMSTTQHFANWICTDELNNKFLMYSFMASRDSLIHQGQGTTVKTIYMPDLKEMRIQLPPIKEQHNIVQEIESRLSVADKMEESITQSLLQAEALRQSILKKAFEGELIK